jgi:NhaA family Na+:H+ antiporter
MSPPQRTGVWGFLVENSLLLVAGTLAGLIWANVDHHSYEAFAHAIHFAVNDIGMVFFFALATKEIVEATLPGGPLESPREAGVPLLAAVGGMLVPALIYTAQAWADGRPEIVRGWAVPCATDIAFSYMAARLIFPRQHPAIPFLLLLAIADDALGLILLALFYPSGPLSLTAFVVLMTPALFAAFWLKRQRVMSFWAYVVVAGGLSWAGLYYGGIHPALALVPIVPFMPHAKRDLGLFAEREEHQLDTMNRFEHWWKVPVQFVLFFFGLVNAGVPMGALEAGTWGLPIAVLIGRPVGVLAGTGLARLAGFALPQRVGWRELLVTGLIASMGFSIGLFFCTALLPPGQMRSEVSMGVLLTLAAAPLAFACAALLGVGRFSESPR